MIKKVRKKTCSKAKREKEILRDLDVLIKEQRIIEDRISLESDHKAQEVMLRDRNRVEQQISQLEGELRRLWTEPGISKRRARARDVHS